MDWKRSNKGLLKPSYSRISRVMSPSVDRSLTRLYSPGYTSVCNITSPHSGTSFLEHKNLKALSKICLKAVIFSSVSITVSSSKENRFWTNSATAQQGLKDQVGLSARWFLGHLAMMNWSGSMSIFLSTKEGPSGNTKQCCFAPWNACSDYKNPIANAASRWRMRGIFTELLLETKCQGVFTSSCGRRAITTQGQSAAFSWAYISKASLTTKGNWYPSA